MYRWIGGLEAHVLSVEHFLMTSAVFELWSFSLFTAGYVELKPWFMYRWIGSVSLPGNFGIIIRLQ